MPYGENYCQLQLLFVFDCYWPSFAAETFFSGCLPCFISWSWCWCSALHTPSGLRVSFPEPCPNPDKLWIPARVWICNAILSSTYAACGIDWSGLTMSPNSFFGSYVVILKLTVVFHLFCLRYCVWIRLHNTDSLCNQPDCQTEPVMTGRLQPNMLSKPSAVLLKPKADLLSSFPLVSIALT